MPITSGSEFAVFHFNDLQPELEELDEEGIPMADFERHSPGLQPPSYITVFGHDREFDPPARAEDLTIPEPNNAGSLEGSEITTRELAKQSRVRRCGKWCLDYVKGHYGLWIFFHCYDSIHSSNNHPWAQGFVISDAPESFRIRPGRLAGKYIFFSNLGC
jgi:hypothetical protein